MSLIFGRKDESRDIDKNISRFSPCFYLNVHSRTFKTERITILIFSFCIGLVTQLNGPALGISKHHYITKRIRELLIGNSRFLIYNLLNQLLYDTV